jgi:hypothetical protein
MKLESVADLLNKQIRITRYPNQDNRFSASLDHAEVKTDGGLVSAYGNVSGIGATADGAIRDYAKKIAGETIVFGAYTEKREEFTMPTDLA